MQTERADRIVMRVPSRLRYGEATRAMLDVLSARLEVETGTPSLRHHVISAFSEAFNNVVEHAHRARSSEPVEVEVAVTTGGLEVAVADRGGGFALDEVEDPDLETLPEGGLGLLIIRSLMTSVDYERGEPNVLRMYKAFATPLRLHDEAGGEQGPGEG